jgi:gentisate 1,2-dioxygenase
MSAQTQATQASKKVAQDAFAARMAEKHITPLWTVGRQLVMHEPTPRVPPVYWNYQRDVRPHIMEAADIIPCRAHSPRAGAQQPDA